MTNYRRSEVLWRLVAAVAMGVGAASALAPGRVSRLYGMPAGDMNGTAAVGWRLFGVRTVIIGAAALRGVSTARRAVIPVQLLDQTIFLHALATRSVPRRSALLAMATSGLIIALSFAASRAER